MRISLFNKSIAVAPEKTLRFAWAAAEPPQSLRSLWGLI